MGAHTQVNPALGGTGYPVSFVDFATVEHSVESISAASFENRIARLQTSRSNKSQDAVAFTLIGKKGEPDKHFLVGGDSGHRALTGANKYTRDYFLPYVLAGLTKVMPQGGKVCLAIARPPDATQYQRRISDLLLGSHHLRLPNGEKIKITIVHVMPPFDEPHGALMQGLHYVTGLGSGEYGLFDLGGKIGSLVRVTLHPNNKVEIHWKEYGEDVLNGVGIRVMKDVLYNTLTTSYPDQFPRREEDILDEIIRSRGVITLDGVPQDYKEEFTQATATIINPVNMCFVDVHNRLPRANGFLLSGGGNVPMLDIVREQIFKYKRGDKEIVRPTHLVDMPGQLHFATAKGGAFIMSQYLWNYRDDPSVQKIMNDPEVVMITNDAGNAINKIVKVEYGRS